MAEMMDSHNQLHWHFHILSIRESDFPCIGRGTANMRFLIHGFYGAGNAGDDALLHAIIEQILVRCPEAQIDVIVRSKTLIPYFGSHPVGTVSGFDLNMIHHAVASCDILIVGGGGLFQDYSGFSVLQLFQGSQAGLSRQGAINYYSAPMFMAKTLGKKIFLYGLGIGPFHSREAERATAWICGLADAVTVRDYGSYALLTELGVNGVTLTGDPALWMGDVLDGPLVKSDKQERPPGKELVIGLNLREWTYGQEEGKRVRQALIQTSSKLAEEHGAKLRIYTFNRSKREEQLAESIADELPVGSVEIVHYTDASPLDMKRQFAELDLMIAMRLHACILSLTTGTPAIGLSYDPKVTQLYEELQLTELCMPIQHVATEGLYGLAMSILGDRAGWKSRISENLAPLRLRETKNGEILSKLMGQKGEES